MSENSRFSAPQDGAGSDSRTDMGATNRQAQEPEAMPPSCASPRMARLLLRYDDLDPIARAGLRRHADTCAECGSRWELFQAADTWLEGAGGQHQVLCPETEELYDFGRGPGYGYMSTERRTEIELHVSHCESCADFAGTLASSVPIPWTTDGDSLTVQRRTKVTPPIRKRVERKRSRPRLRLLPSLERVPEWVPVAVAAGLMIAIVFATRDGAPSPGEVGAGSPSSFYPELPVLRGEESSPLLYPRGNVLADETRFAAPLPPSFELTPVDGAELYRIQLRKHAGGAFDVGTELSVFEDETPTLSAQLSKLAPGHYTWEAWALVRGLERPLGERDFRVVADAGIAAQWQELESLPEEERGARRVALLHNHGYFGEARTLAESLPASEERDAYLEAWPGR